MIFVYFRTINLNVSIKVPSLKHVTTFVLMHLGYVSSVGGFGEQQNIIYLIYVWPSYILKGYMHSVRLVLTIYR